MLNLALAPLETAINELLAKDQNALDALSTVDGQVIQLTITDWNISLYALPYSHGIQLLDQYDGTINAAIQGKLFSLLKLGLSGAQTKAMFNEGISISGDTKSAETIRHVFSQLDIDWEAMLTALVGKPIASTLARLKRGAGEALSSILQSLKKNTSDYLQYESHQVPTKEELNHFFESVSKLRNDSDRLDAKIQRLKQQQES